MSAANHETTDAKARMLGTAAGAQALGRGPVPDGDFSRHDYHHPTAGWGAARSVGLVLEKSGAPEEVTSFSRDGSTRSVYGYRAVSYDIPPSCAAGYMPELNVLCGIADYSTQSGQPVTKHLTVQITRSDRRAR